MDLGRKQIELGWNKLTKVKTNWLRLKQIDLGRNQIDLQHMHCFFKFFERVNLHINSLAFKTKY